MDKQREMFEEWLKSQGKSNERSHAGPYFSYGADIAWQAWQAAIAAQWQPIETAPENEPFLGVLDCAGDRIICTMRYAVAKQKNSVPDSGDFHRERVTHWMPLPPEPTK